jgi:hypothetical protein
MNIETDGNEEHSSSGSNIKPKFSTEVANQKHQLTESGLLDEKQASSLHLHEKTAPDMGEQSHIIEN